MIDWLERIFAASPVFGKLILIPLFFLLAWAMHRLAVRLANRLVRLNLFKSHRPRAERQATLRGLIASAISFVAFAGATLVSFGLFAKLDTLIWVVGLFSAAFGLGARPLISDVLTGMSLIFEDTFAVGEKVEILGVEGVVEAVNLRTTLLRSPSGELLIMPNGEIRVVRNYSRGRFSVATIKFQIRTGDLSHALALLEELAGEAVTLLPNLLEPWQVLSESGVMGQHTELTLLAKARFGQAAAMKPRLLSLVQDRMSNVGIDLMD